MFDHKSGLLVDVLDESSSKTEKRQIVDSSEDTGSIYSTCNRVKMAHNLTGDICKFNVLEHLDPGDPKITDLDQVIEENEEEEDKLDTSVSSTKKTTITSSSEVLVEECYRERRGEEQSDRRWSGNKMWDSNQDKDDVITVKYLPLKMRDDEGAASAAVGSDAAKNDGVSSSLIDVVM